MKSRIISLVASLALLAGLTIGVSALPGGTPPVSALTNCSVSNLAMDSEEWVFVQLINEYRAQNGLQPLTVSTNLNRMSSWHAVDMATKRYFSHTDSLSRSPAQRGQQCDTAGGIGENIAAGTNRDTAQKAFDAWKASSGHNQNMLHGSYRQIGVARYYDANSPYRWYWVTNFSLYDDGTRMTQSGGSNPPAATATPTRTPTQAAATPTRTPTQVAATATPTQAPSQTTAQIISPPSGSTLPGSSVRFEWTAPAGAREYHIYLGTSQGAYNWYSGSMGTATAVTFNGIPNGSRTMHMRLWTRFDSGWRYVDYIYTTAP